MENRWKDIIQDLQAVPPPGSGLVSATVTRLERLFSSSLEKSDWTDVKRVMKAVPKCERVLESSRTLSSSAVTSSSPSSRNTFTMSPAQPATH